MLLYHAIRKTYDDFEEVYSYRLDKVDGTKIETDKELKKGQIIILKDLSEFAIIVEEIWAEAGVKCFSYKSAESVIVRARVPRE